MLDSQFHKADFTALRHLTRPPSVLFRAEPVGLTETTFHFDRSTPVWSLISTTQQPETNTALTTRRVFAVINFLGMGDYRVYENFGRKLYDLNNPAIKAIYDEAASALGIANINDLLNLRFGTESYLPFKVAFTAHSLAHFKYVQSLFEQRRSVLQAEAFCGISIGAATAAIAAGAISFKDYIQFLHIVTPFQRHLQCGRELTSITLSGESIETKVKDLQKVFPDLTIMKRASPQVVAAHLHSVEVKALTEYCCKEYGELVTLGKIRVFPVVTHSKSLRPFREEIERLIDATQIKFADPSIPILSSVSNVPLRTAAQVKDSLLAILDQPIDGIGLQARIAALEPSLVVDLDSSVGIADIFALNRNSIPIEVARSDELVGAIQQKYTTRRVLPTDKDLDLKSICTAAAELIPVETLLTPHSNISAWQRLKWFAVHPTDVIYGLSKRAQVTNVSSAMRARLDAVMVGDRFLRRAALQLLETPGKEGVYQIPFGNSREVADPDGWTVFGRSISRAIKLSDGSTWSIVFKGAGTQEDSENPIDIAPNRMDYLMVPDHKPLEPQPSWVLHGGEAFHTTKNEIMNAYGLRAVYSLFNESADTAVPLGAFKIKQIPTCPHGSSDTQLVTSHDYFLPKYDALSGNDQIRFLRYLRIDMEESLSVRQQKDLEKVISSKDLKAARKLAADLLETWTPVVYGYLVRGDVNSRIEKWDLRQAPFRLDKEKLTAKKIFDSYGIDSRSIVTTATRLELAESFARALSRAAFYHKMGGDFGSRKASLTPKDVTVSGAILDLHANMLAGAGGILYSAIIHPIKQRWNIENGRTTVKQFAEALELDEKQCTEVVNVFNRAYARNFIRQPDYKLPYRSPFL